MTDIPLRLVMSAVGGDTVVSAVGGTASALDRMSATVEITNGYLASLGEQAFTTGAGFDGMLSPIELTVEALDGIGVAATEADAAFENLSGVVSEDTALISALNEQITNLEAQIAVLTMEEDGAAAATDRVGMSAAAASGKIAPLVGMLGLGATVMGGLAVKAAGDYQSQITSLSTGAGELQSNLGLVSDGILQMATDTGTSTKQLTDGMYMIESAGYHGKQGLDVLKAAAEGAKVGSADLGNVANGTTTIMTDFSNQNINASQAVNTLVATVAAGKTHMSDLSTSLAMVLPTASSAKVGLTDVMAAMATMTSEGVPAADAATYLRQTLMNLSSPSKSVTDELNTIGLTTQQVSDRLKTSLPNTLNMIMDALGKKFPAGSVEYQEALTKIAGGTKTMQGILDLTGQHMYAFTSNFASIDNAVTGTGNKITGFSQTQKDFNFQASQAAEKVETLGIKIGTHLLPTASKLLDLVGHLVDGIQNFAHFLQQNQPALEAFKLGMFVLAGVIAGAMIPALVAMAVAAWAAITPLLPFIAIGAIAGAVIFGIAEAIQHWGEIAHWFQGIWAAVSSWFMGVLRAIGSFFVGVWHGISSFFIGIWNDIVGFFVSVWHGIASFFVGIWNGIVSIVTGALTAVWGGITSAFNSVISFFVGVWNTIVGIIQGAIQTVVGWFLWLYNHNYYFKDLVDGIRIIIAWVVNFLVTAWHTVVNVIVGVWQALSNAARTVWNAITTAIHVAVSAVVGAVRTAWQTVIGWLTVAWNAIVSVATTVWNTISGAIRIGFNAAIGFVTQIWNFISGIFSSAWNNYIIGPLSSLWSNVSGFFSNVWNNYIAGPIGSLWNNLTNTVGGWANAAVDWGKNLIQGFINGITGMIDNVKKTVSNVANSIGNFLGFHSPAKEGVGRELNEWPRNLIASYSKGLEAAIPQLQSSLSLVMQPVGATLSGRGPVPTTITPLGQTNTPVPPSGHTIIINISTLARTPSEIQRFADMIEDELSKRFNRQTSGFASGGLF